MIYPYICSVCGNEFEVIKSVKDIDEPEFCAVCENPGIRTISPLVSFRGISDWNFEPEYDPAFGTMIKSPAHRRKLAKAKGWEEVGTEPVDKIHKAADETKNQLLEDSWSDV